MMRKYNLFNDKLVADPQGQLVNYEDVLMAITKLELERDRFKDRARFWEGEEAIGRKRIVELEGRFAINTAGYESAARFRGQLEEAQKRIAALEMVLREALATDVCSELGDRWRKVLKDVK